MSNALASFKIQTSKLMRPPPGMHVYNAIIRDILPPIVAELEKKIADLQEKVDSMKRPAGTGLSAVRGLQGGRYTRRKIRK